VRPNERELGLTPSTLGLLAGEAGQIPFEPAMLAIARLAAANWHTPLDRDAQLELAAGVFDSAPIVEQLRQWFEAEEGRVVFSEQQFFVAQRLLVEYARDGQSIAMSGRWSCSWHGVVVGNAGVRRASSPARPSRRTPLRPVEQQKRSRTPDRKKSAMPAFASSVEAISAVPA
jgi:hypothetical protein